MRKKKLGREGVLGASASDSVPDPLKRLIARDGLGGGGGVYVCVVQAT